jgi:LacI family transcriptional regulator
MSRVRAGERSRVTITRIAAEAGCSPSTVSKVLNGNREVSVGTRQRVQALLNERSYERRSSPGTSAPPLVDLVFPELESPWAMEIIKGARRCRLCRLERGADLAL